MDEIPKDPLFEYLIDRLIDEDPEACKKAILHCNYMLKKALDRTTHLENKYKDWER